VHVSVWQETVADATLSARLARIRALAERGATAPERSVAESMAAKLEARGVEEPWPWTGLRVSISGSRWRALERALTPVMTARGCQIISRSPPGRHTGPVLHLRLWAALPVTDYLAGALPGLAAALDADMRAARAAYRAWLAGIDAGSHMPAERENMCRAWSADFAVGWGRDCARLLGGRSLPAAGEPPSQRMTYAASWYATQAVSLRAAELTAGAAVLAITAGQPSAQATMVDAGSISAYYCDMGTAGTVEPEWPAVDENNLDALRRMRSLVIGRLAAIEEAMREIHGVDVRTI